MNRLSNRLIAASSGLLACGLVLTGCGAGQISQTADQVAAVNGHSVDYKDIALRNVHIQATQTSDFLKPGTTVPLVFVAANNSADVDDKLVGITSDIGTVDLSGDGAIPAGRALVVSAEGQAEPMGSVKPQTAEVTLGKPISNGLNYNFTFNFEKAGKTTVSVPIAAGEG